ncbi:MAG: 50S ribosomal protein L10 [Pseudomonadota bacterium]
MALNFEQKKKVVAEVAAVAADALSAVAAEYRGLTVEQMTSLRDQARKEGVYLRVAKNTLVRRAVEGTSFECIKEELTGPLLFAFSQEDPGSAARLVKDFAKDNDQLVTKFVSIDGQLLGSEGLGQLASLPTLDQARAQLLGLMKAPAEKFVRTIAEPQAQLVRVLAAYKDKQEAA